MSPLPSLRSAFQVLTNRHLLRSNALYTAIHPHTRALHTSRHRVFLEGQTRPLTKCNLRPISGHNLPSARGLTRGLISTPPKSHTDLSSFLTHAASTSLATNTTLYVGTLYEYTVLLALRHLSTGFNLTRTGGRSDGGVDLSGTFTPPTPPDTPSRTIPCYVQCKAEKQRTGPKYMRELEGTLSTLCREDEDCLGVLATISAATPGMKAQMMGSRRALVYVWVVGWEDGGWVRQLVWNEAASEVLGRGLSVGVRYGGQGGREEVMLMLDGVPVVGEAKPEADVIP